MLFNPNYISGLVQADGSFFVTISKYPKSKYGLRIRATFTITQNLDSIGILEQVQSYFKCGNVFINKKGGYAEFVVNSIPDLQKWIIPHFINYPLHCSKQRSFWIFLSNVDILGEKAHYNKEVFASLIKMAFTMNEITNRGSESLEELLGFLGSEVFQIEIKEPEIKDYPLDTNFLVGLIEGDGSFHISFKAKRDLDFGFSYHSTYFFITPTQKGSTATGLR
jgi:LAGLIDADG endonuclease